ncbi:MAG: YciI family protein [Fimbriiglobus sp.]
MPKFLFVYRASVESEMKQPSPEEMQVYMTYWHAWFAKLGDAIVDGGDGLQPTGRIVKPDGLVTDGPFIEAKEVVGGYSVILADGYNQAIEYAKSCPIHSTGGTIEIRELAGF